MTSKVQQAFESIGLSEDDRHNAMPKLKYLEKHDPEMLQGIVERCQSSPDEAELWISWLVLAGSSHAPEELDSSYLEGYRMRFELYPAALMITGKMGLKKNYVVEVMAASAWQYGERTGADWEQMRAHMLLMAVAPYFGNDHKESLRQVKFVAEHFEAVMGLLPSLRDGRNLRFYELEQMFTHHEEPSDEDED